MSLYRSYVESWHGLPRTVWWLALSTLVNRAGTAVMPFLALYLTRERGLGPGWVSGVLVVWGLGSMAGSLLGGKAGDRFGPRRVQIFSYLAGGLGLAVLPWVPTLVAFGAAAMAASFLADLHRPAVMAAVAHATPAPQRARAMSLVRVAINLGLTVGPAVGGFLAERSYPLLFLVDGATCWLATLPLLIALPREPSVASLASTGPAAGRSPFADRRFLGLLALVLGSTLILVQFVGAWPLYLTRINRLRESEIGIFLGLSCALIVLVEMPLIRAVERRRPLRVAAVGTLLMAVGYGGLILVEGRALVPLALTVVLWTVGEMLTLPLTNGVAANLAEPSRLGAYMGAYAFAFSVAFTLGPAAGTALYALSPRAPWIACLLFGPLVALGYLRLARVIERDQAH